MSESILMWSLIAIGFVAIVAISYGLLRGSALFFDFISECPRLLELIKLSGLLFVLWFVVEMWGEATIAAGRIMALMPLVTYSIAGWMTGGMLFPQRTLRLGITLMKPGILTRKGQLVFHAFSSPSGKVLITIILIAAFYGSVLLLNIPVPGRFSIVVQNEERSIKIDRWTGRTWLIFSDYATELEIL